MEISWTDTEFFGRMNAMATRFYRRPGINAGLMQGALPDGLGHGEYACICADEGVRLTFVRMSLHKDLRIRISADNAVFFTYLLDGTYEGQQGTAPASPLNVRAKHLMIRAASQRPNVQIRHLKEEVNTFLQLRVSIDYYLNWLRNLGLKVDKATLQRLCSAEGRVLHNRQWFPRTNYCLDSINAESMTDPFYLPWMHGKIYELLALASREFVFALKNTTPDADDERSTAAALQKSSYLKVKQAEQILAEHLRDCPSIPGLADRVGMSATSLKTDFKHLFGHTIHTHSKILRLVKAEQLLRLTRRSIFAVAQEVGWDCQGRFAEAFRVATGMGPSEYRSAVRAGQCSPFRIMDPSDLHKVKANQLNTEDSPTFKLGSPYVLESAGRSS